MWHINHRSQITLVHIHPIYVFCEYCYVSQTIHLNISHLFHTLKWPNSSIQAIQFSISEKVKEFQVLLYITRN